MASDKRRLLISTDGSSISEIDRLYTSKDKKIYNIKELYMAKEKGGLECIFKGSVDLTNPLPSVAYHRAWVDAGFSQYGPSFGPTFALKKDHVYFIRGWFWNYRVSDKQKNRLYIGPADVAYGWAYVKSNLPKLHEDNSTYSAAKGKTNGKAFYIFFCPTEDLDAHFFHWYEGTTAAGTSAGLMSNVQMIVDITEILEDIGVHAPIAGNEYFVYKKENNTIVSGTKWTKREATTDGNRYMCASYFVTSLSTESNDITTAAKVVWELLDGTNDDDTTGTIGTFTKGGISYHQDDPEVTNLFFGTKSFDYK